MSSKEDERFLRNLLTGIKHRLVVPVVGRELLVVAEKDGKPVLLDHVLARRVADELGVDVDGLPSPLALRDVASAYARQNPREQEQLHKTLCDTLERLAPPVPRPLQQLAAISNLQIFVSTTFDDLLGQALDGARGQKAERRSYRTPTWVENEGGPLAGVVTSGAPVVYRLFGKASPQPNYALTEDETLEFAYHLQHSPPHDLFDVLRQKQLLFLGCGFQDWLARFFIRTLKNGPLHTSPLVAVADEVVREKDPLALFLADHASKVYSEGAVALVARLHDLWLAEQPAGAGPAAAATSGAGPSVPVREGVVFLSFASEDREIVRAVRDKLALMNVETFFDESSLAPGAPWRKEIEEGIRSAWLFVPFLSRRALAQRHTPRVFWREWNTAAEQVKDLPASSRFVVPVALDDTPQNAPELPAAFREPQWVREVEPQVIAENIRTAWRLKKKEAS